MVKYQAVAWPQEGSKETLSSPAGLLQQVQPCPELSAQGQGAVEQGGDTRSCGGAWLCPQTSGRRRLCKQLMARPSWGQESAGVELQWEVCPHFWWMRAEEETALWVGRFIGAPSFPSYFWDNIKINLKIKFCLEHAVKIKASWLATTWVQLS